MRRLDTEWSTHERALHFLAMVAFTWILVKGWQSEAWLLIKIIATPALLLAVIMAGRATFGSRID